MSISRVQYCLLSNQNYPNFYWCCLWLGCKKVWELKLYWWLLITATRGPSPRLQGSIGHVPKWHVLLHLIFPLFWLPFVCHDVSFWIICSFLFFYCSVQSKLLQPSNSISMSFPLLYFWFWSCWTFSVTRYQAFLQQSWCNVGSSDAECCKKLKDFTWNKN